MVKSISTKSDSSISTVFRVRTDFKISRDRRKQLNPTPVNVIIWAMEILGKCKYGVPIQKIRSLIKNNFILPCKKKDVDKKIDLAVMFAVNFGILNKSENLYYLKNPNPMKSVRFQ